MNENHDLSCTAHKIRCTILDMCVATGGHIASSFSCVDILVALYHGGILKIDSKFPDREGRDRFILSKGHGETALYAVLADKGFFPKEWLKAYYRCGECRLGGHPDHSIPGVEITSGSLGHGLGIAAGLALAAKMSARSRRHFVLMGDAECTEGSVWEAAMFASKHELNNLIAIVDRNGIGSLDYTRHYTGLEPFDIKWQAFGWKTRIVNGHDMGQLLSVFDEARNRNDRKPFIVIAETIKGKGVSFIENNPIWHVKALTDRDEIEAARKELETGRYDRNTS